MGTYQQAPWNDRSPTEQLLYSVAEAGRQLGVGRTTAWALIRQGVLETTRIGGRTLVTRSSLEELARTGVAKITGYRNV